MNADIAGSIILALPALLAAYVVLWRRQRPVFWFACALILIGVGYLAATGAAGDIGRRIAPSLSAPAPVAVPAR